MEVKPTRLLILDDELPIGRLLVRVARAIGWQGASTASVAEFQALVRAAHPDVILLDLHLGAADGIEQLRFLHAERYRGSIVLMSGFADRVLDAARRLGMSLGLVVVAVIQKPATVEQIRAVLGSIQGDRRDDLAALAPSERVPPSCEQLSAARLGQAVADGELRLTFQPIVGGVSRTVEKLEALARWHHPERGVVMPDEFIPLGEQDVDVIDRLTLWVVRTAIEQSKLLRRLAFPATIAVNLSAKNLRSLDFPDQIAALVADLGASPADLTLEITESAATEDPNVTIDILTRLRLKGFGLAMDDFGTGFSSLKALLNSPFSELKIDKSFVANALTSREARVVVKQVARLARDLGLKTVAEGVETQSVVDQMLEFGVDSIQGYHISRPLQADQLPAWLADWSQAA